MAEAAVRSTPPRGRPKAELTTKKIKRGTHTSVRVLERDIRDWIATWNENPRPYVWHKSAEQILASLARYCAAPLATGSHHGAPHSQARTGASGPPSTGARTGSAPTSSSAGSLCSCFASRRSRSATPGATSATSSTARTSSSSQRTRGRSPNAPRRHRDSGRSSGSSVSPSRPATTTSLQPPNLSPRVSPPREGL